MPVGILNASLDGSEIASWLYRNGNKGGAIYQNRKIANVQFFDIMFEGENADISVDEFRFGPESAQAHTIFAGAFERACTPLEKFTALFTELIGVFQSIFTGRAR